MIKAFWEGEDFIAAADVLEINRSTARNIVTRAMNRDDPENVPDDRRGRAGYHKIDDEMRAVFRGVYRWESSFNAPESEHEYPVIMSRMFIKKRTVDPIMITVLLLKKWLNFTRLINEKRCNFRQFHLIFLSGWNRDDFRWNDTVLSLISIFNFWVKIRASFTGRSCKTSISVIKQKFNLTHKFMHSDNLMKFTVCSERTC